MRAEVYVLIYYSPVVNFLASFKGVYFNQQLTYKQSFTEISHCYAGRDLMRSIK
jgi:hypothetical protein